MAFSFRSKAKTAGLKEDNETNNNSSKLSSSQMNKLTKAYPPWLRHNVELKYLPAIYQGVLGQVQLQPDIHLDHGAILNQHRLKSKQTQDYMNKYTDTERARKLLSASRLPNETLAAIWAHVNQTFPGRLTNREFCLALALVAHFQRLHQKSSDNLDAKITLHDPNRHKMNADKKSSDPFDLVKIDDKPPVPILYPSSPASNSTRQIPSSKSVPNRLGSEILLVDLEDDNYPEAFSQWELGRVGNGNLNTDRAKLINLIDSDGDNDVDFIVDRLTDVWTKLMISIRCLFKRSFDILNVENCRTSALEALRSKDGVKFIKQLCICYPLAHNVKTKIDELIAIQCSGRNKSSHATTIQTKSLNKNFASQINDLMLSINEYWAVLINLFHESGQTSFIEIIMDSLDVTSNRDKDRKYSLSERIDINNTDKCCICLRKEYLCIDKDQISSFSATKSISSDDLDLIVMQGLISQDNFYKYHARCANFWLNQVDSNGRLPFIKCSDDKDVLRPNRN